MLNQLCRPLILFTTLSWSLLGFTLSIENSSVASLQAALSAKELRCEEWVAAHWQRIHDYNLSAQSQAPYNAFTEINPSLFEEARALDNYQAKHGKLKGPMHCVTVVLKDNIDSTETTSTSGSFSLLGNQPVEDAELVKRLKSAGAIIIGKGGMDEFASGTAGISTRSGRVGNAYDTHENPGGSSSGSAVAVATRFAMIGIGTDNNGSIRIPAAYNGVFGLRPTAGNVPTQGIFPRGPMNATAGPIARNAPDLALTYAVLHHESGKNIQPPHFDDDLKGKRFGVLTQIDAYQTFNELPTEVKASFEAAYATLTELGATIVPDLTLNRFIFDESGIQAGEREAIQAYLANFPAVRKNYEDICRSERTLVFGSVKHCLEFTQGLPAYNSLAALEQKKVLAHNRAILQKWMKKNKLDAIILPVTRAGFASYRQDVLKNESVAALSGLPALTFPIGYGAKNHLPIGIEIIGRAEEEETLFQIAYAFDKNTATHPSPQLPKEILAQDIASSIPHYNQYIMQIGYRAFQEVLMKAHHVHPVSALTPGAFQKLVRQQETQEKDEDS